MAELLASAGCPWGQVPQLFWVEIVHRGDLPADTDLQSATARPVGPVLYLVLIAGGRPGPCRRAGVAADFWGSGAG